MSPINSEIMNKLSQIVLVMLTSSVQVWTRQLNFFSALLLHDSVYWHGRGPEGLVFSNSFKILLFLHSKCFTTKNTVRALFKVMDRICMLSGQNQSYVTPFIYRPRGAKAVCQILDEWSPLIINLKSHLEEGRNQYIDMFLFVVFLVVVFVLLKFVWKYKITFVNGIMVILWRLR